MPGGDARSRRARGPALELRRNARVSVRRLALGRALRPLRDEGVLVIGSGNVTHNLRDAMQRDASGEPATPEWARAIDEDVAQALRERDARQLARAWPDARHAREAHPHSDHWFPLLYAYAATDERDAPTFPIGGFDLGSLSMRAVRWG